jgi:hypothetical protein
VDVPVPAAAAPEDRWFLKTPEGQTYGPVTRSTLDAWVIEGRIGDDCRLLREAEGVWQEAATAYPVLRPKPVAAVPAFDSVGPGPAGGLFATSAPVGRVLNPHRGGLILALGILGWALGCPVFGVMAWIMGSNDLREMQRGAMDTSGMGMTQAGQIIGMLHSILTLVGLVVGLFVVLAMWL